mgnify:CR=1 FL=1
MNTIPESQLPAELSCYEPFVTTITRYRMMIDDDAEINDYNCTLFENRKIGWHYHTYLEHHNEMEGTIKATTSDAPGNYFSAN